MDIATLIGMIAGVLLIGWAIISGAGDKVGAFVDPPSIAIVIGGTMAVTLISFPLKAVLGVIKVTKNAFLHKAQSPQKLIEDFVSYAEVARRDGILSLENVTKDIKDEFVIKGIQMAIDGTDPELIEQILNSELEGIAERHTTGKSIFDCGGKYAPAFGMIGTLIGLIIMLQNMEDPSSIGAGMAVALLTTLYGAVVANLICLPLADKLGRRSSEELLLKEIVIRGVMSIQSGDNPRVVEQKLKTYLPPSLRAEEDGEDAA
ncbi:MAG: MotA/TolQ/ExbB proton channel family protein [Planctomycetes bacterium]|nr:MotA/TolQ/ExbB proton channel family protein [Planctomycetota bacterium]